VTERHAKNKTGKKGKLATSGPKRRIQLARKRCKRFKYLYSAVSADEGRGRMKNLKS
jgi:hypothetical protein